MPTEYHRDEVQNPYKKPLELLGASRTGASRPTVFQNEKIQQISKSATFS